jgi:hypothetical protein
MQKAEARWGRQVFYILHFPFCMLHFAAGRLRDGAEIRPAAAKYSASSRACTCGCPGKQTARAASETATFAAEGGFAAGVRRHSCAGQG